LAILLNNLKGKERVSLSDKDYESSDFNVLLISSKWKLFVIYTSQLIRYLQQWSILSSQFSRV